MNRVSTRVLIGGELFVCRSKCFIHTVPAGNVQGPFVLNVMNWFVFGTEIQRLLTALSDQNGTLILYGMMPALGMRFVRSLNAPVAESVAGNGVPTKFVE